MTANHRMWGASLLCLGLALGATACGSSSAAGVASAPSVSRAGGSAAAAAATAAGADPLAGKSAVEIVALMRSDMLGLKSVHFVAHGSSGGKANSWDLHDAPGRGCYGNVAVPGYRFALVVQGSQAWIKMDEATIKTLGLDPMGTTLLGKYVAVSATSGSFTPLTQMCDLTKAPTQGMPDSSTLTKGSVTTLDGAPVVELDAPDGSVVTVTDTAHPYLLSIADAGTDSGTMTFSDFDQPFTLTPPPASQVVHVPGF